MHSVADNTFRDGKKSQEDVMPCRKTDFYCKNEILFTSPNICAIIEITCIGACKGGNMNTLGKVFCPYLYGGFCRICLNRQQATFMHI